MPRLSEGAPRPVPAKTLTVHVPVHVHDRMQALADKVGLGISDVLRLVLNDIPDQTVPESLRQAAEAIRIARGLA